MTTAVAVIVPRTVGLTAMVMLARAPAARLPRLQTTVPPLLTQLPWVDSAEPKRTLAGSVLVTNTPVAVEGPWLVTETV